MCSLYRLPGFVISRFFFIHIFCHYWGKGNRSFYRGLRYIEVPLQWGSKKNTNKEVSGSYHVVLMICFLSLIFNLKRFAGRIIPHLSGVIQLTAPRHNQTKLAFCTAVRSFRYHFISSVQAGTTESQHCWAKNVGNCCVCVGVGVQTDLAQSHADVLKLRANERNNSRQCWELLTNKQAKQGKEKKKKNDLRSNHDDTTLLEAVSLWHGYKHVRSRSQAAQLVLKGMRGARSGERTGSARKKRQRSRLSLSPEDKKPLVAC